MRFRGKVSGWFYAIIIGVAVILLPIIVVSAFVDPNRVALAVNLAVLLAVEAFCIPVAFFNYVELQEDALLVVFGLIRKKLPYGDIASLSATHDPSASLAASLDRIEIKCIRQSNVMVAVADREGFLREMKKAGFPIWGM